MMAIDYGIPCNSISVRNPQANAFVERVHQTIGNIIRTFKIQEMDLDNENPWEGPCFPYGLRCTLLSSMHRHNCYLVGNSQHQPGSQLAIN